METRTVLILSLACLLLGGVLGWLLKPCPVAMGVVDVAEIPTLEIRTLPPDTVRVPGRIRYRTHTTSRATSHEHGDSVRVPQDTAASPVLAHDTTAHCPDGRYCVAPFVADTTVTMPDGDTIRTRYEFPQNLFTLIRRQLPDTLRHTTRIVTVASPSGDQSAGKPPTFWETLGTHMAALGAGFLLGSVTNR